MTYPVITLWQPWAQWVALGWKTIETRTHMRFKSLVGKDILIHCGLNWDEHAWEAAKPFLSIERLTQTANADGEFYPVANKAGFIIAKARVIEHRALMTPDSKEALIDCSSVHGRYGLFLKNIELLPRPIQASGKQGIWYL